MNQRFPENPTKPNGPNKPGASNPANAQAKPASPKADFKQKLAAFEQNGPIKVGGAQQNTAPQKVAPPPRPQREKKAPANEAIYANIPDGPQASTAVEKPAPINYEIYGNIPPQEEMSAKQSPAKTPLDGIGAPKPVGRKLPEPPKSVKGGPAMEAQAVMFKIPDLSKPVDQQDHRPAAKQPISYTVNRGPGDSPYANFSALVSKPGAQPGQPKIQYGNRDAAKVPDKTVKVEKEVERGKTETKQVTLPANGEVATGKFIVGANSNWIQKTDQGLVHYNAADLSQSAQSTINASMYKNESLTVSTRDKQLDVTPARKR